MQLKRSGPGARTKALLARFKRDHKASVAIEFAFLAIPFALVMFAILESCASFAAQELMANAVDDVARRIRTGDLKEPNEGQVKAAICAQLQMIASQSCSQILQIDLRDIGDVTDSSKYSFKVDGSEIKLYKDSTQQTPVTDAGGKSSYNMLRAFYPWPVVTDLLRSKLSNFGGSSTLLYTAAVWRNEAY